MLIKDFFTSIPVTIKYIFAGRNFYWHILAVVLTFILVKTGFDWLYFISVRNEILNAFFRPALFGGFLLPIFVPVFLIIISSLRKNFTLKIYALALAQASFLGWLISSTYKVFTGRIQPNVHNLLFDGSHGFQFGFWEHGIFWGWPSSHTTVAFAISFAAITLLPKKNSYARAVIFLWALYVGIGVSLSIHWFSDFVAGAILGTVIGITVGKRYKEKLNEQ